MRSAVSSAQRQLGLLWGFAATLLVALSPLAPQLAGRLPPCPVRSLVGVPCLSCGATRAALALSHFDVVSAFLWNPLAAGGWLVLVVGGLAAGVAALAGRPLPDLPRRLSPATRWAVLAAIAANWIYLYYRGV